MYSYTEYNKVYTINDLQNTSSGALIAGRWRQGDRSELQKD